MSDFFDGIDDEADLGCFVVVGGDFGDDDAGEFGVFDVFDTEFNSEVDNGDDFAAEVDNAFGVFWHLRDGGDVLHADDFEDFEDGDAVGFFADTEGEVFAGK